jgi:hypothetical protein
VIDVPGDENDISSIKIELHVYESEESGFTVEVESLDTVETLRVAVESVVQVPAEKWVTILLDKYNKTRGYSQYRK